MTDDDIIVQGRGAYPGERTEHRGIARRIGQKVLAAEERVQLSYAESQALKRDQARPTLNRAIRLRKQAESDLVTARFQYEAACAALLGGEEGETEVAALETEIADLERDVRRYENAARELERRLGVVREPSGHIL